MPGIDDQAREWRRRLDVLRHRAAVYGINTAPEVLTEIEDLEKQLDHVVDIRNLLTRLGTYRRTAGVLLSQRASFGNTGVPTQIIHQLEDTWWNIAQLKQQLLQHYKISVDPSPVDEEQSFPVQQEVAVDIPPPDDTMQLIREGLVLLEGMVQKGQRIQALQQIRLLKRLTR